MPGLTHTLRCRVCFQPFRSPSSLKRHTDEAHTGPACAATARRSQQAGRELVSGVVNVVV
jgi:hypothetical protein